jgi:hypothetical protein
MIRTISLLSLILLAGCDNRNVPQADSGPGSDATLPGKDASGPLPDGLTGCAQNSECAPTAYCKIEGACAVSGAKLGTCTPRPEACDTMYAPVCGCDGKTHGNACGAAAAGVNVAYSGECTQRCGNQMFLPACPATELCDFTSCGAIEGHCVKKPTPAECAAVLGPTVCGCDGKTYPNDCERQLAGVARAALGACPTPTGITVVTDKSTYSPGQNVKATLSNGSTASVFLAGCAAYAVERKEGGVFVDKGTTVDCAWEGNAKEVKPGASLTENVYPYQGGTYRIRADHGLGCLPQKPLSSASCASFGKVHSAPFVVQPDAKDCANVANSYALALAASRSCDPAINMPQCLHKVEDHVGCGCMTFVNDRSKLDVLTADWKNLGCTASCPPIPCASLPPSGICGVDKQCHDNP